MISPSLKKRIRETGWRHEPFRFLERHIRFMECDYPGRQYPVSPGIEDPVHLAALEAMNGGYDHWRDLGFVAEIRQPCIIEDLHGMLINAENDHVLPNEVLGVHRDVEVALPFKFKYQQKKRTARRVEAGLVLHHHYGVNFTHFYADVLSKLVYFYAKGFPKDIPVIVFRSYYEMPIFQSVIKGPNLRHLKFIIQEDDEYLLAEKLYVVKPLSLRKEGVLGLRDLCDPGNDDRGGDRRIYLMRSGTYDRGLSNRDEVTKIAEGYGFEAVEPSVLDLREQIEIFQQTRYMFAEHGSAEINLFHRKVGTMSTAEFFPKDHIAPIFDVMSMHLGFTHFIFRAEEGEGGGPYQVPPETIHGWFKKLLST